MRLAAAVLTLLLGAAVVRATAEEAELEAEVVQPSVMLELESLQAVYAAAERPKKGSKNLNMAKYVDSSIKSSNQEDWGCCRVCDDLDDLVQKIPPELEPEYGHSIRDQRRHVAPERGFQEFMPPMVSCCPTCLWPPKLDPAAPRTPTLQGDMETEMATYGRGDGPKDAQVLAGAADNDRVKEFAKFDAPNYRAPTEAMISGSKSREQARKAARTAQEKLAHARKYLGPEAIKEAEAAAENNPLLETAAFARGDYADAEGDAADAEEQNALDAESDADADAEADDEQQQDEEEADADADAEEARFAATDAAADSEAEARKFGLGKAMRKAGGLVKKGLKFGKTLLRNAGKGLKHGLHDAAKLLNRGKRFLRQHGGAGGLLRDAAAAAGGAIDSAVNAAENAAGAVGGAISGAANAAAASADAAFGAHLEAEEHREREREREREEHHESEEHESGAPPPPGGASLHPEQPPEHLSPAERMEWVNRRAEAAEEAEREKAAAHANALRSGVPNTRAASHAMQPHAAPAKPWNPLRDLKGDSMHYSTVTDPDLRYDDMGAGVIASEKLLEKRAPKPYLPPCCNMCGVNNGPRLTQPERVSTCCYYCVRKPYGARPPRMRLRKSTRPLPKAKTTMDSMMKDIADATARPQDDSADIFSPRPPMVHANHHRFG